MQRRRSLRPAPYAARQGYDGVEQREVEPVYVHVEGVGLTAGEASVHRYGLPALGQAEVPDREAVLVQGDVRFVESPPAAVCVYVGLEGVRLDYERVGGVARYVRVHEEASRAAYASDSVEVQGEFQHVVVRQAAYLGRLYLEVPGLQARPADGQVQAFAYVVGSEVQVFQEV